MLRPLSSSTASPTQKIKNKTKHACPAGGSLPHYMQGILSKDEYSHRLVFSGLVCICARTSRLNQTTAFATDYLSKTS